MIDLNGEMDAATDAVTPRAMLAAGLDPENVWSAGGIGHARAETFKGGLYEPSDTGRLLWLLPAFYGPPKPETLADLVVWHPDDPARWWRRTGHAAVLGFANVQRARATVFDFGFADDDPPREPPTLALHPTPKAYALADFTGAVVLDWRRGLAELDGVERIVCVDLAFAEKVESELKRRDPRRPAVLVQQREAA